MRLRRSEGVSMLRHWTVTRGGRLSVAIAMMLGLGARRPFRSVGSALHRRPPPLR